MSTESTRDTDRIVDAIDRLSERLREATEVFERLGLNEEQRYHLALDRKARAKA